MAGEQFGQKLFVDRDLTVLQRRQLGLIVVHQNDVVTKVGETRACHQPYVSGTDHCDPHLRLPRWNVLQQLLFGMLRRGSLGESRWRPGRDASTAPLNSMILTGVRLTFTGRKASEFVGGIAISCRIGTPVLRFGQRGAGSRRPRMAGVFRDCSRKPSRGRA